MNYRKKAVLLAVALLGFHLGICAQSLSLKMQNVSVKKAMTELPNIRKRLQRGRGCCNRLPWIQGLPSRAAA